MRKQRQTAGRDTAPVERSEPSLSPVEGRPNSQSLRLVMLLNDNPHFTTGHLSEHAEQVPLHVDGAFTHRLRCWAELSVLSYPSNKS